MRSANVTLLLLSILLTPPSSFAQSPQFLYELRTNGGAGGPFPSFTLAPPSWSSTIGQGATATFSGSASESALSLTSRTEYSGNVSGVGVGESSIAKYDYKIWVRGPASVRLNVSSSGNASATVSGANPSAVADATYGPIPFGSSFAHISVTGNGNQSDSLGGGDSKPPSISCGGSGVSTASFAQYPGVTYYLVYSGTVFASMGADDGTVNVVADGTSTFTPVLGASAPVAQMSAPPTSIVPGASLALTNLSYDPDNEAGTTPLTGVCAATWTVTNPNGTQSVYSALSGINLTAKQGEYTVELEVTDNEGMTSQTSTTFHVGAYVEPKPGDNSVGCDGDNFCGASVDPSHGNLAITCRDPVRTRGYALTNDVHLNSQAKLGAIQGPFGNANFTYGIRLRQEVLPSDPGFVHVIAVDGDGRELDFGRSTANPLVPEAAVFSELAYTGTGLRLSNAGAPGQIEEAGNFTYDFNQLGLLTQITDPHGNIQTLSYDGANNLLEVLDVSSTKRITFEYDAPPLVARVVENSGGAVTHFTYDNGRLESLTVKDAQDNTVRSAAIEYNSQLLPSRLTKDNDPATALTFSYVNQGSGVYVANVQDTQGGDTKFDYSEVPPLGATFRTSQTNAKGGVTYFDYDAKGNLLAVTLPQLSGATQPVKFTYSFNAEHLLTSVSDGATSYALSYTPKGQLSLIQNVNAPSEVRQFGYSGLDLTSISDSIGTLLTLGYTDAGNPHVPTTFTDGAGNTWTRTLNQYGQVLTVTPPSGSQQGVTTYTYQENAASPYFGYLRSITNGAGDVIDIGAYTALGDVSSITTHPTSNTANTVTLSYDPTHRLTKIKNPDGTSQRFDYVGKDLTAVTDEAGTGTTYEYCPACDKLTAVHAALGKSLTWQLDGDKDVDTFTDPLSNVTDYVYGLGAELKQITFPDNQNIQYRYDNSGRLLSVRLGGDTFKGTYSYDVGGRVQGVTYSGASNPANSSFTYYSDGALKTVTDDVGITTYTYTPARLIDTVSYDYSATGLSNIQLLDYDYYPDGLVSSLTWKNGPATVASWSYSYDGAGRFSSVTSSFGESVTYGYDGEGKVVSETRANGTSTQYIYNQAHGLPIKITHKQGSTPFARYSIYYDGDDMGLAPPGSGGSGGGVITGGVTVGGATAVGPLTPIDPVPRDRITVGNITRVKELDGSEVNYTYDALYRLTAETRTGTDPYAKSYGYDLLGNMTHLDGALLATYDGGNKVATVPGGNVTHDSLTGALLNITVPGVTSGNSWFYDGDLSLAGQTKSSETINYDTDGLGRRVRANPSTGVTKFYIFDGTRLLGEISSAEVPQYVYTWGESGIVSMRHIGTSQSYYHHYGPQGETRQLTGSTGAVAQSYLYTAYGRLLTPTANLTLFNPHRYGGKFGYYTEQFNNDPAKSLTRSLLAGARWYNPDIMRWLTRDPILYDGGSNLYEYVGGRPVTYHDSTGRVPLKNLSPRPITIGGNPGIITGLGPQIPNIILNPGQRCGLLDPIKGVRDVDAVDINGDGIADVNDPKEKLSGSSITSGWLPIDTKVVCKPGSFAPGCEIMVIK